MNSRKRRSAAKTGMDRLEGKSMRKLTINMVNGDSYEIEGSASDVTRAMRVLFAAVDSGAQFAFFHSSPRVSVNVDYIVSVIVEDVAE